MSGSEDVNIEVRGTQPTKSVNDDIVEEWVSCYQGNNITQRNRRQIHKVPSLLLKDDKTGGSNYKPTMVSLGPYHHNQHHHHLSAAEKFKLITLEEYRLSCEKSMGSLVKKVLEVVDDARKCYIDGSTDEYSDEQFHRMMLHDGCFVLFFIDCLATQNKKVALFYEFLGAVDFKNIARDIFLLENQIPFVVLQVLLDLRFSDSGEEILNTFFNYFNYGKLTTREEKVLGKEQPLHLLELYRSYFISLSCSFGPGSINSSKWPRWSTKKIDVDDFEDWNYVKRNRSFASVMELKAKGIFVKCNYDESSNEDIKFRSHCCYGELELVPRAVLLSSKVIYLNMIAYEMCPHNPNDFRVSTYIRVMKSLVIHHEDVKELRYNNILLHSLGRDEQVVKMYDEIDVPLVNINMFNQLRRGIENHCNNKYKRWVAELINVYFSSPWKTVALLVATAILFSSFLQTYFTIRPLPDDSGEDIIKLLRRCVHSKPPSAPG